MATTSSMGLHLPVQGAIDRTALPLPGAGTAAGAMGVEASQWQALIPVATQLAQKYGPDIVSSIGNAISSWF